MCVHDTKSSSRVFVIKVQNNHVILNSMTMCDCLGRANYLNHTTQESRLIASPPLLPVDYSSRSRLKFPSFHVCNKSAQHDYERKRNHSLISNEEKARNCCLRFIFVNPRFLFQNANNFTRFVADIILWTFHSDFFVYVAGKYTIIQIMGQRIWRWRLKWKFAIFLQRQCCKESSLQQQCCRKVPCGT